MHFWTLCCLERVWQSVCCPLRSCLPNPEPPVKAYTPNSLAYGLEVVWGGGALCDEGLEHPEIQAPKHTKRLTLEP